MCSKYRSYVNAACNVQSSEQCFAARHPDQTQMRVLGSSALEEGAADDGPSAPPAFLMEVMETREQLEHCSTMQEAEGVLKQTGETVEECLVAMDAALKEGGGKDELADAAIRLRYLYRIEDEARSIIHRLEDAQHAKSSTVE